MNPVVKMRFIYFPMRFGMVFLIKTESLKKNIISLINALRLSACGNAQAGEAHFYYGMIPLEIKKVDMADEDMNLVFLVKVLIMLFNYGNPKVSYL